MHHRLSHKLRGLFPVSCLWAFLEHRGERSVSFPCHLSCCLTTPLSGSQFSKKVDEGDI